MQISMIYDLRLKHEVYDSTFKKSKKHTKVYSIHRKVARVLPRFNILCSSLYRNCYENKILVFQDNIA